MEASQSPWVNMAFACARLPGPSEAPNAPRDNLVHPRTPNVYVGERPLAIVKVTPRQAFVRPEGG